MPIHNKLPEDLHEVDVIISGGRSTTTTLVDRQTPPHVPITLIFAIVAAAVADTI